MKKIIGALASPKLMAFLLFLIAFAAGFATFVENDYGSPASRSLVYNSWWFELLFMLLSFNLVLSIFRNKLYARGKLPVVLFHISFVVIIIGAAITRYTSVEGTMHIREGESINYFTSTDTWLTIGVNSIPAYSKKANYTVLSSSSLVKRVKSNGKVFRIKFKGFIPNATEKLIEDRSGSPLVSLMIIDSTRSRNLMLKKGKTFRVGQTLFGFESADSATLQMHVTDSGVVAVSTNKVEATVMGQPAGERYEPSQAFLLKRQTIYRVGQTRLAFSGFSPSARKIWVYNPDPNSQGRQVLYFQIEHEGGIEEVFVPKLNSNESALLEYINGVEFSFAYGNPVVSIPFEIKLYKFVLERYPGSESPSSFTSHVTVIDREQEAEKPFSIFMNNILNYRGYRFYQSSYDTDEQGTYLSVNSDALGTSVTYFGYFLMILGMLLALILRGSRFRMLVSKKVTLVILLITITASAQSANAPNTSNPIAPQRQHAIEFGRLVVQDKGGRMKPLSTLAGEVLRKLNRSNSFKGLNPEQVFLGMSAFPDKWQEEPIILVKNEELRKELGIAGNKAAFINFFDYERGGEYKLKNLVQWAFTESPAKRTAYQKEVIKADERLNILYQIFSGQIARIFPLPGCEQNQWQSMAQVATHADSVAYQQTAAIYAQYLTQVRFASRKGNYTEANLLLKALKNYQQTNGGAVLPNNTKLKAESLLNRYLINERLIPFYGILGFVLLVFAMVQILGSKVKTVQFVSFSINYLLVLGFIVHTVGIGLRWYVAGRAPLSNGFETMIYIAWTTMLAGLIFNKRNSIILPATALLSTITLFVAHLSWMDPEITNLVPVLKSYWLTIHVSVVTASYGFLGMGSILALFNLFLIALSKKVAALTVLHQIKESSRIIEAVLILGLYLLTIGSFLGAIWANESWGRYWGWDPKETWALITIIVYTFITHMRQIPNLNSLYVFNFASALGISSVLMTYFGVNYYLSGLHSYAGGEAAPFPKWIVLVVIAFFVLSFFAWIKSRKLAEDESLTI